MCQSAIDSIKKRKTKKYLARQLLKDNKPIKEL